MSPALRYARILNGFSFLISRRSAISLRIRAIPALSKPQAFGFDAKVQDPRATAGERRGDRLVSRRRAIAEQTAATAGPTHLGGRGARSARTIDQILDERRRHAR